MALDKKKWSNLRYELADSGVKIKKYWKQGSLRTGVYVSITALLCLTCLVGTYLLWATTLMDYIVQETLTFKEGRYFYDYFLLPKYVITSRAYIYNYTNAEEFLAGKDAKLKVEELGPYSYREGLERVVLSKGDDTLSYSENRTYAFLPDESGGAEDDQITTPNFPLIAAISRVRDGGMAAQLGLRSALWAMDFKKNAFDSVSVREYLFGYSDALYEVAADALRMTGNGRLPKLGIFAGRVGVSRNVYTVHTGERNYSLVDVVSMLNDKPALEAWSDPDCNRIDASEGTFFSPEPLRTKSRLHLTHVDFCRRWDFDFQKELTAIGELPAYRYAPPQEFFHNATDFPDNACYRDNAYPDWPSGVFLDAACFSGAPLFISFPRFYQGHPSLREMVEGVGEPDMEKHQFYVDVHNTLGINVGIAVRNQVNIMIRKSAMVGDYLDRFEDGLILPQLWWETVIEGLDSDTTTLIWHLTYTLRWIEVALKYVFPVLAVLFGSLAGRRIWVCFQCRTGAGDAPW